MDELNVPREADEYVRLSAEAKEHPERVWEEIDRCLVEYFDRWCRLAMRDVAYAPVIRLERL